MKKHHYIYAHYESDTGELFHIGIGTWTEKLQYARAYKKSKKDRNKLWHNIVNKHGIKVEIIKDDIADRDSAVNIEVMLQLFHKPRACFIYGDRCKAIVSDETKAKISVKSKGRKHTDETKALISKILTGNKQSPEAVAIRALSNSKPIINCRGDIFPSLLDAAKAFRMKGTTGITAVIKGNKKSAGKYSDGTKITWNYYRHC